MLHSGQSVRIVMATLLTLTAPSFCTQLHFWKPFARLNLLLHFPYIVNLLKNSSMKQNLLQVIERMTPITESKLSLSKFSTQMTLFQVQLECEERGDMLLHVWRQLLRVFNQVVFSSGLASIRSEPKIDQLLAPF